MGRYMRIGFFVWICAALILFACVSACGKSAEKDDLTLIKEYWSTNAAPWIEDVELGFAAYDERIPDTAWKHLLAAREKGCTDPIVKYRFIVLLEEQSKTLEKQGEALKEQGNIEEAKRKTAEAKGKTAEVKRMYAELGDELAAIYPEHRARSLRYLNLGNIEFRAENYEGAFQEYEKAYLTAKEQGRVQSEIYYSMGMALRRMEQYTLAANWLERASKNDFRVNFYLAEVYHELHKHDLAMQRMRRAVQLEPASSSALGGLANFYTALSEREEKALRFHEAGKAIQQSMALYKRAIAAGGEVYAPFLEAAEWRMNNSARLQEAAKKGLLPRETFEGEDEPVEMQPPELPEGFF